MSSFFGTGLNGAVVLVAVRGEGALLALGARVACFCTCILCLRWEFGAGGRWVDVERMSGRLISSVSDGRYFGDFCTRGCIVMVMFFIRFVLSLRFVSAVHWSEGWWVVWLPMVLLFCLPGDSLVQKPFHEQSVVENYACKSSRVFSTSLLRYLVRSAALRRSLVVS